MHCDIAAATARLASCQVDDVDLFDLAHDYATPSAGGQWQALVPARPGLPSTYYVRLDRHPRHWPRLRLLSEGPAREEVLSLPWRHRLDLHRARICDVLPDGLRVPTLHHVERFDDDHVGLWWELVRDRGGRWSDDELGRAAYLLGRLAARRREGAEVNHALPAYEWDGGSAVRRQLEQVLATRLPRLRDDGTWQHPAVEDALTASGDTRLRHDLLQLSDALPAVVDRLDRLPQTYAHGDAAPRNLLRPPQEPDTVVVTGWGLPCLYPVGYDVATLLVGQAEDGLVDAAELARLATVVCDGYRMGLEEEGYAASAEQVGHGFLGTLLLRYAFWQLPVEALRANLPPTVFVRVRRRLALSRAVVDLAAAPARPAPDGRSAGLAPQAPIPHSHS